MLSWFPESESCKVDGQKVAKWPPMAHNICSSKSADHVLKNCIIDIRSCTRPCKPVAIWFGKKEDLNRFESSRKVEVLEGFDVFVEVQCGDNLRVGLSMIVLGELEGKTCCFHFGLDILSAPVHCPGCHRSGLPEHRAQMVAHPMLWLRRENNGGHSVQAMQ